MDEPVFWPSTLAMVSSKVKASQDKAQQTTIECWILCPTGPIAGEGTSSAPSMFYGDLRDISPPTLL